MPPTSRSNPLIESGKVRALAKLDRRSPASMANMPTLADAAGLPNLDDMSVWLGLVAPKGTPRPIIDKLQQKVVQIMADPAMREKSERTGAFPMTSTPEEFGAVHPAGGRPLAEGAARDQHQVRLSARHAQSGRMP